jgi:hypothetical protein
MRAAHDSVRARPAILGLLHPRGQGRLAAGLLLAGLLLGWLVVTRLAAPIWLAAALTPLLLLVPALRKWRADQRMLGWRLTVLSVLLVAQGLHTVEHLAQFAQYHLLGWPLKAASGLISPLNAEVVHFVWNWAVVLTVYRLLWAGLHRSWMWLLFAWATAHTAEHTYMFLHYVQSGGVQGLPGILGAGGWLAQHAEASPPLSFVCMLAPGLVSAPRLDVHFWWNIGEIVLLVLAAQQAMSRSRIQRARRSE